MHSSRWYLHIHAARKNAGACNIFSDCWQYGGRRLRCLWGTFHQIYSKNFVSLQSRKHWDSVTYYIYFILSKTNVDNILVYPWFFNPLLEKLFKFWICRYMSQSIDTLIIQKTLQSFTLLYKWKNIF